MTTKVTITVEQNGGPTGKVLVGTRYGQTVNAALYSPGDKVELYVHGECQAFAREASAQDIEDRKVS